MDNQPSGKTYAVVIGVGNYPTLPTIANTINDAKDLHALLIDPQRGKIPAYNARLMLDKQATAVEIDNKLNWLASTATADDTVIIYFSGHGFSRAGGRAAGSYLCPYDTDTNNLAGTAFSSGDLQKSLSRITAARLALFLDACYAGGTADASTQPGLAKADYQTLLAGQGRALFASSQAGETSYIMPDARNSLFTACLLEVLSGRGVPDNFANISTASIAAYLNAEVPRRNPKQHPMLLSAGSFDLVANPLYKADGSGIIAPPPPVNAPAFAPTFGPPTGEAITPSKPMIKIGTQNINTGSGSQFNVSGSGTQNNVTGTQNNVRGNQYNSSGDQFIGNRNVSTGSGQINDYGGVQGGVHNYGGVGGDVNTNYGTQTNIRTGNVTNTGGNVAIGSGINQTSGGPTTPANPSYSPIALHQAIIRNRLSEDDLQLICQYLGFGGQQIDYASLSGANPTFKALALIQYCQQHKCLATLIDTLSGGPDNWQSVLGSTADGWRNWAAQQDSK